MNKKKIVVIITTLLIVICGLTIIGISYSYFTNDSNNMIASGIIKGNTFDFGIASMYVDGTEVDSMNLVPNDYVISQARSYCYKTNPSSIDYNAKLYTNSAGEHIFSSVMQGEKCVLYFTQKGSSLKDIILSKVGNTYYDSTNNFAWSVVDENGYRYEGNYPDNYIDLEDSQYGMLYEYYDLKAYFQIYEPVYSSNFDIIYSSYDECISSIESFAAFLIPMFEQAGIIEEGSVTVEEAVENGTFLCQKSYKYRGPDDSSSTMFSNLSDCNDALVSTDKTNYSSVKCQKILYRIIGLINEYYDTNSDGVADKQDYLIKVIRTAPIGNYYWNENDMFVDWVDDSDGKEYYNAYNNWSKSSLKDTLNTKFYDSLNRPKYIVNTRWHLKTFLYSELEHHEDSYSWITADEWYNLERNGHVYENNPEYYDARIGLLYRSDVGYSVLESDCNRNVGVNAYDADFYGFSSDWWTINCMKYWITTDGWHITPWASDPYDAMIGGSFDNVLYGKNFGDAPVISATPVFYLQPNIAVKGNGTLLDPYVIM